MKSISVAALACAFMASSAFAQMGGMAPSSSMPQRDPAAAYQAGVAVFNAADYPEAIRQLREACRARPNDGAINYALGIAYNANGDKEEAKTSLERAVRAPNAPIPARLQLGLVALSLGDRETATEQQAALQQSVNLCSGACGDAQRTQMQTALAQLTRALAAP